MTKQTFGYTDIVEDLRQQLLSGHLRPGEKLPSESALCLTYATSRPTVRRALEKLQEEYRIETRHGVGSFVLPVVAPNSPSKKHRIIHTITPFMDGYIFPNQTSGIESVLKAHHCTVHLGVTYNRVENEAKILKAILNLRPDGVIAEPTASALPPINAHLYQDLCDAGVPILFINANIPSLSIASVGLDNRLGGYLATKHLIDLGHREIAMICKMDAQAGPLRYAGYADALDEAGIAMDEDKCIWFTSGNMKDWFAPPLLDYMLGKICHCSAVFCYNDQIACTLIEVLRQKNIRVPEDISLVGYDDSEYAHQSVPPCTTVRHPSYEIGSMAAQHILRLINRTGPVENTLLTPVLIPRKSTATLDRQ